MPSKKTDETEDEAKEYIYVVGGDKLEAGQIAIAEVHPDHPFLPPPPDSPHRQGEHQVYVVKDDPKVGGAWVGRTAEVHLRLGRGYLKEAKAPAGTPEPLDGPPTESSQKAATVRQSKGEPIATQTVDDNPVTTPESVQNQPRGRQAKPKTEEQGLTPDGSNGGAPSESEGGNDSGNPTS